MVLLQKKTGVKMTHVPYRGGGPAMNDALGGHVDFIIGSVALVTPQLGTGKIRAIVQTGDKRVDALKDVPTVGESVAGPDRLHVVGRVRAAPARRSRSSSASTRSWRPRSSDERVTRNSSSKGQQMTLVLSGPDELRKFTAEQAQALGAGREGE